MGMGKHKSEVRREFPVNHANPVMIFYDYYATCFACSKQIREPHPAFDIHLKDGDGIPVGTLFKTLKSPAKFHARINHFCGDGGHITACRNHQINIETLQQSVFQQKRISASIIEDAINLESR